MKRLAALLFILIVGCTAETEVETNEFRQVRKRNIVLDGNSLSELVEVSRKRGWTNNIVWEFEPETQRHVKIYNLDYDLLMQTVTTGDFGFYVGREAREEDPYNVVLVSGQTYILRFVNENVEIEFIR